MFLQELKEALLGNKELQQKSMANLLKLDSAWREAKSERDRLDIELKSQEEKYNTSSKKNEEVTEVLNHTVDVLRDLNTQLQAKQEALVLQHEITTKDLEQANTKQQELIQI